MAGNKAPRYTPQDIRISIVPSTITNTLMSSLTPTIEVATITRIMNRISKIPYRTENTIRAILRQVRSFTHVAYDTNKEKKTRMDIPNTKSPPIISPALGATQPAIKEPKEVIHKRMLKIREVARQQQSLGGEIMG
eukprot:TRINITY_DN4256_c0_g1_i1.p2 TRINITY_DN4256_c0_g1~~TRINITY_DN4256_c0_g1_i1.p2  ORF type:complete len:136 (+),score=8.78 TRINITY_DN4256_c0_g1_i1:188-595(+)